MKFVLSPKILATTLVALTIVGLPALADDLRGTVKSVDAANSRIIVHDAKNDRDVVVNYTKSTSLGSSKSAAPNIRDLKVGSEVTIADSITAAAITVAEPTATASPEAGGKSILEDFWHNFKHNLFKPLLLFFYLGFLVPILKVHFEFPYVMYQALTIYLLIAIGWHGGEELAHLDPGQIKSIVGFIGVGFLTNTVIGILAYMILSATTRMRRIDKATVAGYYGSDSAGTFVTTLGVLATAHVVYDAYMPVMLAVMEIPGCLVALYLVARLRHSGMDPLGNMPEEAGYEPNARPIKHVVDTGHGEGGGHDVESRPEEEMSLEKMEHPDANGGHPNKKTPIFTGKLLHEVFLNTGLYLLFGGIVIGLISGIQGPEVTRADDSFFVTLFQGILCLFLLEMGMTASRKLKDLKTAGWAFVAYGILAPNLFATIGILVAHTYAWATGTHFEPGTYVLFAVLCGSSSYIAVPAVQRLAIPEASPTLPLAASLGLTFSYNVTIGIPVYMEIAKAVTRSFPLA
ncbi:hypothetical protein BSF38_01342 [Paludisphaera borealis]|uniref:Sodium-dependent bicarbonate transport family permease n=1 Tax=Paludisphaera borealis TaxID=1387353 RepID=A0A1U7CLX7_9BACT|nr:sodium-dependent bicarbonate transport family permease [Paludisphaera borealis]APW59883.1 hypothetical protein BSF38_01342 [Paludisphaera borealis]